MMKWIRKILRSWTDKAVDGHPDIAFSPQPIEWGTFRSNLYFGMRTNGPQSLLIGLMWYDLGIEDGWQEMRHHCRNEDELGSWGWIEHDGRNYGKQVIEDPKLNLRMTIFFIKNETLNSWNAIIETNPINPLVSFNIGIVVYGLQEGDAEEFSGELNEDAFLMFGKRSNLGQFRVNITHTHHGLPLINHVHQRSRMSSFAIPDELLWRFKGIVYTHNCRYLYRYHFQ